MSMYHNRPTVADMRAMKARGQKISMLYVTNFEEAAAAAAVGINMLSIEGRFETAYRNAHRCFQEAVADGQAFDVTQNHVLDAQVFVEAAHRSAQADGQQYAVSRHDDLDEYRAVCVTNGLMKTSLRIS